MRVLNPVLIMILAGFLLAGFQVEAGVRIAPAPVGSPLTHQWSVKVNGQPVPVYHTMVFYGGPVFFCSFETDGPAEVIAEPQWAVRDAVIRPLSKGITACIERKAIHFTVPGPCHLSVEPNGLVNHPLLVFVDPLEQEIRSGTPWTVDSRNKDPGENLLGTAMPLQSTAEVISFGPGFHQLDARVVLKSNQELYLAPGAWVQPLMPDNEDPLVPSDAQGMARYRPFVAAFHQENITIRGRGVIDLSQLDWHSRCGISLVGCRHVILEGITLLDGPLWTVVVAQSEEVEIRGVKLIGHRESNDGIDLLNSRNVVVQNCFTRVGDDGIVIKTFPDAGPAHDILVEDCVVWNDKVRGIGITAETAEPIHDVIFRNIDLIHDLTTDFSMAWSISIFMADRGPIHDVLFDDIRVEDEVSKFVQVAIEPGEWSTTPEPGLIRNIIFQNVTYSAKNQPRSEIRGYDDNHRVSGVVFRGLSLGGTTVNNATGGWFEINTYTNNISFAP